MNTKTNFLTHFWHTQISTLIKTTYNMVIDNKQKEFDFQFVKQTIKTKN